jgi:hypothetical protein
MSEVYLKVYLLFLCDERACSENVCASVHCSLLARSDQPACVPVVYYKSIVGLTLNFRVARSDALNRI